MFISVHICCFGRIYKHRKICGIFVMRAISSQTNATQYEVRLFRVQLCLGVQNISIAIKRHGRGLIVPICKDQGFVAHVLLYLLMNTTGR